MTATVLARAARFVRRHRRAVAAGLAAVAALYLARRLSAVLVVLGAAWLLAYLLDPMVDAFERAGYRRPRAVGVMLGLVLLFGLGLAAVVLPVTIHELERLARRVPQRIDELEGWFRAVLGPRLARLGLPGKPDAAVLPHTPGVLDGVVPMLRDNAVSWLRAAAGSIAGIATVLLEIVLVPFFAFYMLLDFDRIVERSASLCPIPWRAPTAAFLRRIDRIMAAFLRGQMAVVASQALLYGAGYSLIGVPAGAAVGIISGLLTMIPYAGPVVGLSLAVGFVVLDGGGTLGALLVLGVHTAIQVAEGLWITPRLVGGEVGLPPAPAVLAVFVGGELFGVTGVLLALPVAATAKIGLDDALDRWRSSALYNEGLRSLRPDPASAEEDIP